MDFDRLEHRVSHHHLGRVWYKFAEESILCDEEAYNDVGDATDAGVSLISGLFDFCLGVREGWH